MEFNPFKESKSKKTEEDDMFGAFGNPRDSLDKSEDNPFNTKKPEVDKFDSNLFESGFDKFGEREYEEAGKGQRN